MKLETKDRLKDILERRGMSQSDLLRRCIPLCEANNMKMNKSDISQYLSGKITPKQDKLTILAQALNVSEVWLMGYDVDENALNEGDFWAKAESDPDVKHLVEVFLSLDEDARNALLKIVNAMKNA